MPKKKDTKTVGVAKFAKEHLNKKALQGKTDVLFAAYSSYAERGGRPYWLLNVLGAAHVSRVHTSRHKRALRASQGTQQPSSLTGRALLPSVATRRPFSLTGRAVLPPVTLLSHSCQRLTIQVSTENQEEAGWHLDQQGHLGRQGPEWYLSTSDDQERRSYELLTEEVLVPVGVLVQEVGLEFKRAGMHQRVLTDASHAAQLLKAPSWQSRVAGCV